MKNQFHEVRCAAALLFVLSFINMDAKAQFYTVGSVSRTSDTLSISKDPYGAFDGAKVVTNQPTKKLSQEKSKKSGEKSFAVRRKPKAKQADFPVLEATDSLLLSLIKKRLTVCMPLDLINPTSPYGYRKDPFKKCHRFHDGIDLACTNSLVYAMLSGRVEKVGYDEAGYGNYVVINHGRLQFLYGHLSKVLVKQGDYVDAGTAVAVSGATGRRVTGLHLHLRMKKLTESGWKSVNPLPFIESLNAHINEINERMYAITGRKAPPVQENPYDKELTVGNLYRELIRQRVKHPKIVLAQAILESGHFRSQLTRTHNNIFGIKKRNGEYQRFAHWSDAVTAYRDLVQYKFKGKTSSEYYAFLDRIGYASAKDYIYNVKRIADQLPIKI